MLDSAKVMAREAVNRHYSYGGADNEIEDKGGLWGGGGNSIEGDDLRSSPPSSSSASRLSSLLAHVVRQARIVVGADRGTVFIVDEATQELVSEVAEGAGSFTIRVPFGQGIVGRVCETQNTLRIDDCYASQHFDQKKQGYY